MHLREKCCEPDWRLKRFCSPGEPSLRPLSATTKEARVIFFSSQLVSGGPAIYFKRRPLVRYIISGWRRPGGHFVSFHQPWPGLIVFFFPGHGSWVTWQVAVWSQGLMGTSWQWHPWFFICLFFAPSFVFGAKSQSLGLSLFAETFIYITERAATTASSTGNRAGWIQ